MKHFIISEKKCFLILYMMVAACLRKAVMGQLKARKMSGTKTAGGTTKYRLIGN